MNDEGKDSPASPLTFTLNASPQEKTAMLALNEAQNRLSAATELEESLMDTLEELEDKIIGGSSSAPAASLRLKVVRLELSAARSEREEAEELVQTAQEQLLLAQKSAAVLTAEEEEERARAREEALRVQAQVAEMMRLGRPPAPPDPPKATPEERARFTAEWFAAVSEEAYLRILEQYMFPDLDELTWCVVPDTLDLIEERHNESSLSAVDLDDKEWEEKHNEWNVINEAKVKYQQHFDRLHQQMVDALCAVERRQRAFIVVESERAEMMLLMQLTIMSIEQRERTAIAEEETHDRFMIHSCSRSRVR